MPALVVYTLRSSIGRRRWLGCLVPSAGALLFGWLATTVDEPAAEAFSRIAAEGILSLIVPIVALVVGDAVLGAEARSGVLHFTWLTPTPLGSIVVGRWIGGCVSALVTLVPATVLAALIAGVPEAAGPAAVAAAAGACAYVALFVAIGTVVRRAAVWSIAFVFLVERLVGAALSGIAQLTPMWVSRAVFVGLYDDAPSALERSGVPSGGAGVVRLAVITVVALVVARWRLGRLRMTGASD
jgi:ABC-2 type transport system permease protein